METWGPGKNLEVLGCSDEKRLRGLEPWIWMGLCSSPWTPLQLRSLPIFLLSLAEEQLLQPYEELEGGVPEVLQSPNNGFTGGLPGPRSWTHTCSPPGGPEIISAPQEPHGDKKVNTGAHCGRGGPTGTPCLPAFTPPLCDSPSLLSVSLGLSVCVFVCVCLSVCL